MKLGRYSNTSGLQTNSSGSGTFTSSRGDDSEVTFGAQMEDVVVACPPGWCNLGGASAPPDCQG